jgi:two-component system, cell cycle response regulator CpdR
MSRVVLAVDDKQLVLDITAEMLEDLGCEVVTAPNAKEALENLCTDNRIEVLLTDINMPGTNGCELAERAVRICNELKVIVLCGRHIDGCGFPLVRKPFSQDDLKKTMVHYTGLC